MIRRSLTAFAIVAACALATPMAASAGTYSFALSEPSIALGAFEQNHDGVYRFVEPSTITAQTDGTPYTAGDYARAWLALPGGAAFTQLGGLVSLGSLNVSTGGSLTGSIVVRTSTGSVSTAWSHAITPTYPAYARSATVPSSRWSDSPVRLAVSADGHSGPMRGNSRNSATITGVPISAARPASAAAWRIVGRPAGMCASVSAVSQPHTDSAGAHRGEERLRVQERREHQEEAEEEHHQRVAPRAQLQRLQRHQHDQQRDAGVLADQRLLDGEREHRGQPEQPQHRAAARQRRLAPGEPAAPAPAPRPSCPPPTAAGGTGAARSSSRSAPA